MTTTPVFPALVLAGALLAWPASSEAPTYCFPATVLAVPVCDKNDCSAPLMIDPCPMRAELTWPPTDVFYNYRPLEAQR